VVRFLDDRTSLGSRVIETFLTDVFEFLTNDGLREQIVAKVRHEISRGDCVVIGHSLGSVVGFYALGGTRSGVSVPLYCTLGSPLGVEAIHRRLDRTLAVGGTVETWWNARDTRDIVALNPLQPPFFTCDIHVQNYSDVRNETENNHGIVHYLDDVKVASTILSSL
jgi:hypothetical protein